VRARTYTHKHTHILSLSHTHTHAHTHTRTHTPTYTHIHTSIHPHNHTTHEEKSLAGVFVKSYEFCRDTALCSVSTEFVRFHEKKRVFERESESSWIQR